MDHLYSDVMFSGENFGEYLLTHDLDCELIIAGVDPYYGFVHNKGDDFTDEGKRIFAPILNAKFDYLKNGNIVVHCDNEKLGETFLSAHAGYVANSQYLKWFNE